MSVSETLFNATLVLVPIWLGVIRYITIEADFDSEAMANLIGLGIVIVLLGILYSMAISVENLVIEQPSIQNGLYVLFATVVITGLGGVLLIINEIEPISPIVVAGVPVILLMVVVGAVIGPRVIEMPSLSISATISVASQILAIMTVIEVLFQHYLRPSQNRRG